MYAVHSAIPVVVRRSFVGTEHQGHCLSPRTPGNRRQAPLAQSVPIMLAFTVLIGTMLPSADAAIGYFTRQFVRGDNLISHPLRPVSSRISATLALAPEGSVFAIWNTDSDHLSPVSVMTGGVWSIDYDLRPGQGGFLHASSAFEIVQTGTVLNGDGSTYEGGEFVPPPPTSLPHGRYLLSATAITLDLVGNDVFLWVLGREPHEGEQFTWHNPSNETYTTSSFVSGMWEGGQPVLPWGHSGLFNIGPVQVPLSPPEMTTLRYESVHKKIGLSIWLMPSATNVLQYRTSFRGGSWSNVVAFTNARPWRMETGIGGLPASAPRGFWRLRDDP